MTTTIKHVHSTESRIYVDGRYWGAVNPDSAGQWVVATFYPGAYGRMVGAADSRHMAIEMAKRVIRERTA